LKDSPRGTLKKAIPIMKHLASLLSTSVTALFLTTFLSGCGQDGNPLDPFEPDDPTSDAPPSVLFVAVGSDDPSYEGPKGVLLFNGHNGNWVGTLSTPDELGADRGMINPTGLVKGPENQLFAGEATNRSIFEYQLTSPLGEETPDLLFESFSHSSLEGVTSLIFSRTIVTTSILALVPTIDAIVFYGFRPWGTPRFRHRYDLTIDNPTDMTRGPGGHIYISRATPNSGDPESGNKIVVLKGDYTFESLGGFGRELTVASGIAALDNKIYVIDEEDSQIYEYDMSLADPEVGEYPRGNVILPSARDFNSPTDLAGGPDNRLYVMDSDGIHRFDPETGVRGDALVGFRTPIRHHFDHNKEIVLDGNYVNNFVMMTVPRFFLGN
jgi:hypothetical protein